MKAIHPNSVPSLKYETIPPFIQDMIYEPCTCKDSTDLPCMSCHTISKVSETNELIESMPKLSDKEFVNVVDVLNQPDAFNPLPISKPNPLSTKTKRKSREGQPSSSRRPHEEAARSTY